MDNQSHFCFKLRTGETLFAELLSSSNDGEIHLANPFNITYLHQDEKEMMSGSPWCPYTDNTHVVIAADIVYYSGPLNSTFVKYYGGIILQHQISLIKHDVSEKMQDRNDYHVMMEGIERIKAVSTELSEKFGFPNEINTEDFEKAAEKYRPAFH